MLQVQVVQDWANYMNHSCDPNLKWVGDDLVSCRAIRAGEEITYDYGTSQSSVDPLGDNRCQCGAACCRGLLRAADWNSLLLRIRYGPHYVPYLRNQLGFQPVAE